MQTSGNLGKFTTPVLLLIFNRPDKTRLVFKKIRELKPMYLYLAADGPRENKPDDKILCEDARKVVSEIDWECEICTLFNDKNLGSKYAVSSAITWLFESKDFGIILEDDCIPNMSFFIFCQSLLTKYKDDNRIMHITGSNLNDNFKVGDGDYYYSRYPNVWGWATWRRAWIKYDLELNDTNSYFKLINQTFKYISEQVFWKSRINIVKANLVDAWDYQWMFTIWRENGICLNSNVNLVTNIGFDSTATHTKGYNPYVTPETKTLNKITHPSKFKIYEKAEAIFIMQLHGIKRIGIVNYYFQKYLLQRCKNLIHKIKNRKF